MKKSLVACLLSSFCLPALADVQVFGLLDAGLTVSKYQGGDTVVSAASGNEFMSRLNFVATEPLANGWVVVVALEQGFDLTNGSRKDVSGYTAQGKDVPIFNNQSTLSVAGPYGEFGAGLLYTFAGTAGKTGWAKLMDATEATYMDAGLFAMGNYSVATANTLYWISPEIKGFQVGMLYSFNGVNQEDNLKFSQEDPVWNIALKYEGQKAKGLVTVEGTHYGSDGDNSKRKDTLLFRIGGQYDFGSFKLYGNYSYNLNATRFSVPGGDYMGAMGALANMGNGKGVDYHSFALGARIPVFGGDLVAQAQFLTGKSKNSFVSNGIDPGSKIGLAGLRGHEKVKKYTLALGYTYPLSKRTHLYWMNSYSDGFDGLDKEIDPTSNRLLIAAGITAMF